MANEVSWKDEHGSQREETGHTVSEVLGDEGGGGISAGESPSTVEEAGRALETKDKGRSSGTPPSAGKDDGGEGGTAGNWGGGATKGTAQSHPGLAEKA